MRATLPLILPTICALAIIGLIQGVFSPKRITVDKLSSAPSGKYIVGGQVYGSNGRLSITENGVSIPAYGCDRQTCSGYANVHLLKSGETYSVTKIEKVNAPESQCQVINVHATALGWMVKANCNGEERQLKLPYSGTTVSSKNPTVVAYKNGYYELK